eukprot:jgi/Undpi1/8399/HiC_scaffold_25.g10867.m1
MPSPCPASSVTMIVSTPFQLETFIDSISCAGEGVFEVSWRGILPVQESINVFDGKNLTVTGVDFSGAASHDDTYNSSILGLDSLSASSNDITYDDLHGGIDAGNTTGIFSVSNGSTLSLSNMLLKGGYAANGGGVKVASSSSVYAFGCAFVNNSATTGGAIHATSSEIHIDEKCYFAYNSAEKGGAVAANKSEVYFSGDTTFAYNEADLHGGGVFASSSTVSFSGGNAHFFSNTGGRFGGALHAYESTFRMEGSTSFNNNSVQASGGALDVSWSTVVFSGNTTLSANSAQWYGGAIYADNTSEVQMEGNARFARNSADYGGAIAGYYSDIVVGGESAGTGCMPGDEGAPCSKVDANATSVGNAEFIGNSAISGGGAIWSMGPYIFQVSKAIFQSNGAELGGAIYVGSTNGIETEFSGCTFEGNEATDGGAVYLYTGTGVDAFTKCMFRDNYAKFSGGGIFHTGFLHLARTNFEANRAGSDGTAVMSIGILEQLSDVVFSGNAYECPVGEYGYIDYYAEADFCSTCFDEVCARCSTGSGGILYREEVEIDGLPVCEEVPSGATASSKGTTVETLSLEEGYYRTSNTSHAVLECYQKSACLGGIAVGDSSCASGYKGPYCAVCADGYARGTSYSCHRCSHESVQSAVGIMVVVSSAILLIAAILISHMWSVVHEKDEGEEKREEERSGSSWGRKFQNCRAMVVRVVPLTAIKIVITVWQIVYQFNAIAGNVYPELYQNFVSKLSPINVDIGFSLTYSCVVVTNFYDRLLLATIAPPLMLVVLAGSYVIGKVLYRRSRDLEVRAVLNRSISGLEVSAVSNRRRSFDFWGLNVVRQKHQQAALFVLFLVYSSVSYTVFQTFVCDELDNGVSYLRGPRLR